MFTRVVEMTSKSGKSQELANIIDEKAVPILKKQRGFVDEIVLVSHANPDRVSALSFWNKQEDASNISANSIRRSTIPCGTFSRPNPKGCPEESQHVFCER